MLEGTVLTHKWLCGAYKQGLLGRLKDVQEVVAYILLQVPHAGMHFLRSFGIRTNLG